MMCAPVLQDFSVGFSQGGKKGYPTGKKYGNITFNSYVTVYLSRFSPRLRPEPKSMACYTIPLCFIVYFFL